MEVIIGIVVGILAFLGFTNLKPKDLPEDINDDRVDELEEKLEELEVKEKELEENGAGELPPDQVVEYWEKDK